MKTIFEIGICRGRDNAQEHGRQKIIEDLSFVPQVGMQVYDPAFSQGPEFVTACLYSIEGDFIRVILDCIYEPERTFSSTLESFSAHGWTEIVGEFAYC